MTFTLWGITAFEVQYWNGSAWVDVPGGNVTGNNLVWRRFLFAPISTDRIRVLVNNALAGSSRIMEVEAWSAGTFANLTAPANNAILPAPATVSLSAQAYDAAGAIGKVEFYRDTTLVATVTAPARATRPRARTPRPTRSRRPATTATPPRSTMRPIRRS